MKVSFLSAAITLSSNLKITGYENTWVNTAMLTGMGHPLLSDSYSIISNSKSLFNMNNHTHIIGDPSIEAYFRTFLQYAETKGFKSQPNSNKPWEERD